MAIGAICTATGPVGTQTTVRFSDFAIREARPETFRVDFWSLQAREDKRGKPYLTVPMRLVQEEQSWFDWDETTEEQTLNVGASLPSTNLRPPIIGTRQSTAISETIDSTARLVSGVEAADGAVFRSVTRGADVGSARDGDAITFDPAWQNTPKVRFLPGGLSNNTSLSGDQTLVFNALNLSGSGFTADLKNKELVGATTQRVDSTVSTPSSPAGLDHSINKSQTDEAYNDLYTFQYDVTVANIFFSETSVWIPGSVTVGIYTNDGAGWVLRTTKNYPGSSGVPTRLYSNETVDVVVDGLGLNDDFGINIESDTGGSSSLNFDSVTYETAAAPVTEPATPAGASSVDFLVVGG